MKIAIIGAGASGLTSYLYLVKHLPTPPPPGSAHQYIIYESYAIEKRKTGEGGESIPLVGAGLGIAPNGMKALRELDESLHDRIQAKGFPAMQTQFRNGRGWYLGAAHNVHAYSSSKEAMVMIARQNVLECLFERVPEDLIQQKTVVRVSDALQPMVEFADGTSETFDLVIGADGVRSKVRSAILTKEFDAYYTGLYGVGGFISTDLLEPLSTSPQQAAATAQVVMTFGGDGFFGYSPCTTDSVPLSDAQLNGEEAVSCGPRGFWWSSFERADSSTRDIDVDALRKQLRERHRDWLDPSIQRIINETDLDIMGVSTWVMPKAPTWVGKRVALVGDAAHALPSSSGQGISQAMLDSQALAILLAQNLNHAYKEKQDDSEALAIERTLQQYTKVRRPMVERILDMANRMGDQKKKLGFVQEMLLYGMLKIIFTFFSNAFQEPVLRYDLHEEIRKVSQGTKDD